MKKHVFTEREVNQMIPEITELFARIISKKGEIDKCHDLLLVSDLITTDHDTQQKEDSLAIIRSMEELLSTLKKDISILESKGCIIRDIDNGLVDFYFMNDEILSLYSWKFGEQEIKYWRPIDSGVGNRQLLIKK